MTAALIFVLVAVASVAFHLMSPWWWTPIASNWHYIDGTITITFWITGVVFCAVVLFMAWCVFRYRAKPGHRAAYEPENKRLEIGLTLATALGVAAMLAPGLVVWYHFVTVPAEASEIEIVGQQWRWSYRLPGRDEVLGRTDMRFVSIDNPFGMDPDDPAGQDDVLVANPELHLPIDKPVKVLLRSKDVNHQFAVPQFRVKMDMVPGMVTYFWLTPTRTGSFDALCEQLCGMAHFAMRGRVVVDEQADYDTWLAAQPSFARTQADLAGDAEAGRMLFATCVACHGAQAEGNRELNAPKLSGQGKWYLAQQLRDFRNGVRGTHEKDTYGQQMVPFAGMLADDAAIRNVVEYISTLEEARPASTVHGDPDRGRDADQDRCHGQRSARGGRGALPARLAREHAAQQRLRSRVRHAVHRRLPP